jgi:hypothetical protein
VNPGVSEDDHFAPASFMVMISERMSMDSVMRRDDLVILGVETGLHPARPSAEVRSHLQPPSSPAGTRRCTGRRRFSSVSGTPPTVGVLVGSAPPGALPMTKSAFAFRWAEPTSGAGRRPPEDVTNPLRQRVSAHGRVVGVVLALRRSGDHRRPLSLVDI